MKRTELLKRYARAQAEYRTANRNFLRAQEIAFITKDFQDRKAANHAWGIVKRCKRKSANLGALIDGTLKV